MTEKTKKLVQCLSGLLLSGSLALSGICLIAACLGIYFSGGEDPYSPATVAAAYHPIAWALWLSIGLAAVCLILQLFLPDQSKLKAEKQLPVILARLRAGAAEGEALQQANALAAHRKKLFWVGIALMVVESFIFLGYALNGSHFHDHDINGSVIRAMWVLLPCMGIPFGWSLFAANRSKHLMEKEIALLGNAPKAASPLPAETPQPKPCFCWVRWFILGVGIGILVYGFFAGGTLDVLTKAINICTECVGLG